MQGNLACPHPLGVTLPGHALMATEGREVPGTTRRLRGQGGVEARFPLTLDPLRSQRDGVRHLNLMEFLKEDGDLLWALGLPS